MVAVSLKKKDISAVALDKTGTLTTGELAVVGYEREVTAEAGSRP